MINPAFLGTELRFLSSHLPCCFNRCENTRGTPRQLGFLLNFTLPSAMGVLGPPVSRQLPPTEDQTDVQPFLDACGLEYTPDRQFIRWSFSNKKHPRNWPASRKIYDTGLIIFLDLFTYVIRMRICKDFVLNSTSACLANRLTNNLQIGRLLARLG